MKKIYFLTITAYVLCMHLIHAQIIDVNVDYESADYQEIMYIHADKSFYLAGETAHFKVYCLEKITSKPSQLSKVAYVELLNTENIQQAHAKVELQNGSGYGQMFIPTNINSGNLVLRGYTRWMQNTGPESFFHQVVPIINTFRRLGLKPIPNAQSNELQFFPEGGIIIEGEKTNVVFEIKNGNGYPISAKGKLLANDSVLISEFETLKNGLGNFNFLPEKQKRYHVELTFGDSTISTYDLPETKIIGLSMQVVEANSNYLVNLFCNDPQLLNPSKPLLLALYQKGKLLTNKIASLNEDRVSFEIEKSLLNDGVATFTLFDANGTLVKERNIFHWHGGLKESKLPEEASYGHREQVQIRADEYMPDLDTSNYDMSISVSAHHPNFDRFAQSFKHYLLLENTLPYVYGLDTYFDETTKDVSVIINNLLIAHQQKSTKREVKGNYIPEYRGPLITGNITNRFTNEPASRIMAFLSIPGKLTQFYTAPSKMDGSLAFEMSDFYGDKELVVQTNYTKDSIYTIKLDNPYSTEFIELDIPEFDIDQDMESWILAQSENMQIENAYAKHRPKPSMVTEVDSSSFYNEPDSRYFLDDYTRFIVMEEVMREYVTGVNVRKNRNGFHFMVLDLEQNIIYDQNPLMLVDGVPVFDADEIIAIDPLKVKKIETVKRTFHKGLLECKGIVSYSTYNGDLNGYNIHDNALVTEYEGIQPRLKYSFPSYPSNYDKRIKTPDFRNSLYWNPTADSNEFKLMDFYSSDAADQYRVRIEGLDKEGNVVSGKAMIEVK